MEWQPAEKNENLVGSVDRVHITNLHKLSREPFNGINKEFHSNINIYSTISPARSYPLKKLKLPAGRVCIAQSDSFYCSLLKQQEDSRVQYKNSIVILPFLNPPPTV
jgi:hypothetical protein